MTQPGGNARAGDDGSIAPMVAVLGLAFLLVAGLVIDASRQLNARGRALAYAEEAARAGAQSVDPADRNLTLDADTAAASVANYCGQALAADSTLVTCEFTGITGTNVTTRTETRISTSLLGIVGVSTLTAHGEGSARPLSGATENDVVTGDGGVAPPGTGDAP